MCDPKQDKKLIFLPELFYQAIDGVFTGRDKDILLRRFGLGSYEWHTLEKAGMAHNISRERVRQIEEKALKRFKAAWKTTIKLPSYNSAAVQFKEALDSLIQVDENGLEDRIIDLLDDELAEFNTSAVWVLLEAAYGLRLKSRIKKRIKQQRLYKKEQDRYGRFFKFFNWPESVNPNCREIIVRCEERVREIDSRSNGQTGRYFSKKLKAHVCYESELEHKFLWACEKSDDVVYYREQPLILEYCYLGDKRKYVPDLLVVFKDGRGALCEIKATNSMVIYKNLCKYEALKHFCEENGLGYCMTDNRHDFEHYRNQTAISNDVERAFISALEYGPIDWQGFKQIRDHVVISRIDLFVLVFKHELVWEILPFRISRKQYVYKDIGLIEERVFGQFKSRINGQNEYVKVEGSDKREGNSPEDISARISEKNELFSISNLRKEHARAYVLWSKEDDEKLKLAFLNGADTKYLAEVFQRRVNAIRSRLRKLGLIK